MRQPLRSWHFLNRSRNTLHFIEPKDSLPYSQQPATRHTFRSASLRRILIFSSHLPSGLWQSVFPTKLRMHFCSPRHVPHIARYKTPAKIDLNKQRTKSHCKFTNWLCTDRAQLTAGCIQWWQINGQSRRTSSELKKPASRNLSCIAREHDKIT
jgi:hypothetical protein